DRGLELFLSVGASQDSESRDGDERAAEGSVVGVLERPRRVELRFGAEAGPRRELAQQPGLREVGIGRRIRRPGWEERPRDLLHRLEVATLVRAPHLDHDRRPWFGDAPGLA